LRAIPQSLIASELFGHEKGAFTGALSDASAGSSQPTREHLLDESGSCPRKRSRLLRVLQDGSSKCGERAIVVDVRVLARRTETSRAVRDGVFARLFYRLNVIPISSRRFAIGVVIFDCSWSISSNDMRRRLAREFEASARNARLFEAYHGGQHRELQNVIDGRDSERRGCVSSGFQLANPTPATRCASRLTDC